MNKTVLRMLALILIPALVVPLALMASTGESLARDIAYYQVTSSSYDQAVDVPFVVTVDAHDSLHNLVTDNSVTLAISSNSPTMVFDCNSNGVFGEASDNTGILSYGKLYVHAKDTVAARGAIITVTDSNAKMGSSNAYAVSPTTVVSADGWAWQNPLPQGNYLRAISGRSSEDVFAVGDAGTILHYNGVTWMPMSSGTAKNLDSVWASPSLDVFAVCDEGVRHYDGVAWTSMREGNALRGVWGTSRSNVFAVGDSGVVIRYDGTTWTAISTGTTSGLWGVWGSSSSDIFAVGDSGTILHYDDKGVAWTSVSGGNTFRGVWGTSASDVFAVGDAGTITHYDGATWTAMSSGTASNLYGVWGSSPSDAFAVGDGGTLLHYDGATWTAMSSGTASSLHGVWGSPTGDIMAVGGGVILHCEGDQWFAMGSGATDKLNGIWGSSSSDIFAIGEGGTILHYDGSSWTRMDSGTTVSLFDVWGSSPSDVYVVGGQGVVLHYDGSIWGQVVVDPDLQGAPWDMYAVWGSSASDVWVSYYDGRIYHYDGTDWEEKYYSVSRIERIWGTSSSDVYAVSFVNWGEDYSGKLFHYDGSSWSVIMEDANYLYTSVWGSSSSDILIAYGSVTGGQGYVSRYDGSTWTQMYTGLVLARIWGQSSSDVYCASLDGNIIHYDGVTWAVMSSGTSADVHAIWGTSSSNILAVGDAGAILHYPALVPSMVNTVTPGSSELGKTLDVIINGSNLKGATTLMFGPGVTVNSFTVETPSRITASITVAADAAAGARNVYVFTGNGVGRLYSGFMVSQAASSPSAPKEAAGGWLLGLWILLGILGAGVLGGLAFLLSKRWRKGSKPARSEREERPVEMPERKVEPAQAPEPVFEEEATANASPLGSISVLKARLASVGSDQGTGRAATEETASSEETAADKKPRPRKGQGGPLENKGG